MKITVQDVMNNEANIRDCLSYDEETGRIFVQIECLDKVLIDKSKEWAELIKQAERVQELERFKESFDELYGQGLEVAEWHMNGDLEPFDNFYDSAIEHMEGDSDE